MKLHRYQSFFQCCKTASHNRHIDLLAMSDSDKDGFVAAYLRDLGGSANNALADAIMSLATPEQIKNDAYGSLEQVLLDLCQQYNDWIDIRHNIAFTQVNTAMLAMHESSHKPTDF